MNVGLLRLQFRLPGCASLKEKRARLRGLRDRFGRQANLAVCEAADADVLGRSEWWFVAAASSRTVVEQMLTEVEHDVQDRVDAEVVGVCREWLT